MNRNEKLLTFLIITLLFISIIPVPAQASNNTAKDLKTEHTTRSYESAAIYSPVYRFWSGTFGHHFYTISGYERDFVIATWPDVWNYEGPVFYAYTSQISGTSPVYRFWSNIFLGHFYTISEYERDFVIATWPDVWNYEGPVFYALPYTGEQHLQPADFQYLGAFRLPGGNDRPATFAYGGNAMTFNPNGDPSGVSDGFPGSLFVTGHDRLPYGELPNGSQIAEISIPIPVVSGNIQDLNQASFLQDFRNAAQGLFDPLSELPRIGMQYLSNPATGPRIHLAWGQHFQEDTSAQLPSHAWISPNLSSPSPQGTWYIGNQSFYSVNGYMFDISASWADLYAGSRYLATGRYRDGGWSGQGPSLFAYRPWIDTSGTPAPSGTHLAETVLLQYESSAVSDDVVNHSLNGYQHADEWEGGAWITTTTGKSAVIFAGTKGTGAKYWYGWINPAGSDIPCVETAYVNEFTTCRLANGSPCPAEDLSGCTGHTDYRGWWSSKFDAQFILYDPSSFARVSSGELQPWEPQPYAVVDIDNYLFLNPSHIEEEMIGTGAQRRYRIGDVAYDRNNDLIYVLELFSDEAKPVVHVWRVR
jgi:hypothetical protein